MNEDAIGDAYAGQDWIGESRHAWLVRGALNCRARYDEALAAGDGERAAMLKNLGERYLLGTQNVLGRMVGDGYEPKRIVSDEEARELRVRDLEARQRREDAAALAQRRAQAELRANPSAYRPYSGGLPTLGKRR